MIGGVPSEQVRGAGAALAQEPSALMAKLTVAWITETNDLRMATLGCLEP
ncbi:MAG TPA: hypothetical protein VF316_00820 [Polyangiaceae bacterium]